MRQRWFNREFDFSASPARFGELLERLGATSGRAERLLGALPRDLAARRLDGAWSMLDNVGHLTDLEGLHVARVGEILAGTAVLTPADPRNRRTDEAGHAARDPGDVVADLRRARALLLDALGGLSASDLERSSLHPRLNRPMRVADLALFVAEHDDHHLVRAAEIAASLRLEELPWGEKAPGLTVKLATHGPLTLRLLDVAPGFADAAECKKRHDLFLLSGVLEVDVAGRSEALAAGRTCSLEAPHRARSPHGARLVAVEPVEA